MAKMVNNTFAYQKHRFVKRYANVVFTTFHLQDLLIVDHHLKENGVMTRGKCVRSSTTIFQGHPTTIFGKISVRKAI